MQKSFLGIVILFILIVGGYYGYIYVKENPPDFLIKLVTHQDPPPPLPQGDIPPLTVADGFAIHIFARDIPGARVMTKDPKGTLIVSQTSQGKVVALPDTNSDGEADSVVTILSGLQQPHGILIHCSDTGNTSADQDSCVLYVAETDTLKSYSYDADTMRALFIEDIATFPSGDGHYTRTLLMHPDGKRLLASVGSSCNVCEESDSRRATVLQIDLTTKKSSLFAKGLRNTVFMAIDPVMGGVWGTDNGRDLIGDDIPPDEVNIISEGKNYGWPICYGGNIHDTDFDTRQYFRDPCADTEAAHIELQAHSAALGLAFVPEEGWPEDMYNDVLIAYHGSWNRSMPTGYKIVRFNLDKNRKAISGPIDFLTEFLPIDESDTDNAIGRPVDILLEPGGVGYISDDRAGAIYKITRSTI